MTEHCHDRVCVWMSGVRALPWEIRGTAVNAWVILDDSLLAFFACLIAGRCDTRVAQMFHTRVL